VSAASGNGIKLLGQGQGQAVRVRWTVPARMARNPPASS